MPHNGEEEAAAQVHIQGGLPDLDGLHSSSLDCGAFSVHAVVHLLDLKTNSSL